MSDLHEQHRKNIQRLTAEVLAADSHEDRKGKRAELVEALAALRNLEPAKDSEPEALPAQPDTDDALSEVFDGAEGSSFVTDDEFHDA